jgi:hypothetical protein
MQTIQNSYGSHVLASTVARFRWLLFDSNCHLRCRSTGPSLRTRGKPSLGVRKNIRKTAARPPVHAASVVLVATQPTPALSMIERVKAGLKPYQPNQRRAEQEADYKNKRWEQPSSSTSEPRCKPRIQGSSQLHASLISFPRGYEAPRRRWLHVPGCGCE